MDAIIERTAGGIEAAGLETAVLVVAAYLALRWLWLGIRADLARLRGPRKRPTARGEHVEAFDRGLQRLLAELEARPAPKAEPELTAYRRAA